MPRCPKCGVEVEPNQINCPLCNEKIPVKEGETEAEKKDYIPTFPPEQGEEEGKEPRTPKNKRRIVWEISSIVLLISLIMVISIDLIVNPGLQWSLYPVASLVLIWLIITPLLLFSRQILISAPTILIALLVYFLVVDFIDNGQLNWYLQIPLPIVLLIAVVVLIVVLTILKLKHRGLNILGIALIGAGIICLGVDFAVTKYIFDIYYLKWSLYVFVPTTLVGAFLLYVHYRLMKRVDIKRKFHR